MSWRQVVGGVWKLALVLGVWACGGSLALHGSDLLFSFEDGTTEGWIAPNFESDFNDLDAQLSVVSGIGNTDGDMALKVVSRSGDFIRNTLVAFSAERTEMMNNAVQNAWHLEFDWTIIKDENPGAEAYTGQIAFITATLWSQSDLYSINGYPAWDPAGPSVQTLHMSVPLYKYGSGELGYWGPELDPAASVYLMSFAQGGGREQGDTRTFYLDNFRFVDPNAVTGKLGDFNNDQVLDAADIDALTNAIVGGNTDRKYDLDGNLSIDPGDRLFWVNSLRKTYVGDSNLDGEFNSGDLVALFTLGEYEDAVAKNSGWADGDWDGNQDFDSGDFVAAFTAGGYEIGPRAAVAAVPEVVSVPALAGLAALALRRRKA